MPVNSFDNYLMNWKPRLDKSKKPYYLALAYQLEEEIKMGTLRPGTKLPPQRELADYLDVNLSTINKAYRLCEKNGLLSAKVGSGTFVQYGATSKVNLLPQGQTTIELGANIPEPSSYESIRTTLNEMIEDPDFTNWLGYSNNQRTAWQTHIASQLISESGLSVPANSILIASGAQGALSAVLAALFKRSERIGAAAFTYPGFKSLSHMLGIQLFSASSTIGEFSYNSINSACKNYYIKALYVIPDYNNPTTYCMPVSERQLIAEYAKKNNLLIIEDAIYSHNGASVLPSIASFAPEHTIHILSLSKCLAPSLRIAYIAAPQNYEKLIADSLYNLNLSSSAITLELATRLIESGRLEIINDGHKKEIIQRNSLVNEYFSQYACLGKKEAMFRWLILPKHIDECSFVRKAFQQGVSIIESRQFAVGITQPLNAVRIAVGTPPDIFALKQGLDILSELIESSDK